MHTWSKLCLLELIAATAEGLEVACLGSSKHELPNLKVAFGASDVNLEGILSVSRFCPCDNYLFLAGSHDVSHFICATNQENKVQLESYWRPLGVLTNSPSCISLARVACPATLL